MVYEDDCESGEELGEELPRAPFLAGVGSLDTRHRLAVCAPHLPGQPENRRRDFGSSIAKLLQTDSLVRISDDNPIEHI